MADISRDTSLYTGKKTFKKGSSIYTKDCFFGRDEEFCMFDKLLNENRHIALRADRQFGKTACVRRYLDDITNENIAKIFIDISASRNFRSLTSNVFDEALNEINNIPHAFSLFSTSLDVGLNKVELKGLFNEKLKISDVSDTSTILELIDAFFNTLEPFYKGKLKNEIN